MVNNEGQQQAHIVLGGGGTGMSIMARGFAEAMPEARITVINTEADDGGSSHEWQEVVGGCPVGDVRKTTAAFSPNPTAAALSEYRFGAGDTLDSIRQANDLLFGTVTSGDQPVNEYWAAMVLDDADRHAARYMSPRPDNPDREPLLRPAGHPLGNIILSSLQAKRGNIHDATQDYGRLMQLRPNHTVIPVTNTPHKIVLQDGDTIIQGQSKVDHHPVQDPNAARVWLEPAPPINPYAREAIKNADFYVSGPGSLFGSQLGVLAVREAADALNEMSPDSLVVAIVNNAHDKTTVGMYVGDYIRKLEEHMSGRKVDYALYNSAPEDLPDGVLPIMYGPADATPGNVRVDIGAPIVDHRTVAADPNDKNAAKRSTTRTDSAAVATIFKQQIVKGSAFPV